jgi:hypothetical protein
MFVALRSAACQGHSLYFFLGRQGRIELNDHATPPIVDSPEATENGTASTVATLIIGMQPAISTVLHVNAVPVMSEMQLVSRCDDTLAEVTIDLVCDPPVILPKAWHLAEVAPGQVRPLSDTDVALDSSWLASLTESVRGVATFTARTGDRVIAEERCNLRFLAHNEWGGNVSIPDLLAAFVEPNDPEVPGILRKASDLLRAAVSWTVNRRGVSMPIGVLSN